MFDYYKFLRRFAKNLHYAFLILAFCSFVISIVALSLGRLDRCVESMLIGWLNVLIFWLLERIENWF